MICHHGYVWGNGMPFFHEILLIWPVKASMTLLKYCRGSRLWRVMTSVSILALGEIYQAYRSGARNQITAISHPEKSGHASWIDPEICILKISHHRELLHHEAYITSKYLISAGTAALFAYREKFRHHASAEIQLFGILEHAASM